MEVFFESILKFFGEITPNIIGALLIAIIGGWLCKLISKIVCKAMIKKQIDVTIQTFVNQLLKWILYIVLFLAIIQRLGVPVSSFLGALAAAGVAIGLALQGSLSNFAGGIMLLILKPFKIGDKIETQGRVGVVQRIGMFYTTMLQYGNEQVMIPNGPLFAGDIINYSAQINRRITLVVGISYGSNLKKAQELLYEIAEKSPYHLQEEPITVWVEDLADSSVNLSLRVWVNNADYYVAKSSLLEQIKLVFDQQGIEIPFPQRDLNIKLTQQEVSSLLEKE